MTDMETKKPQHIVRSYDDELGHICARIVEMGGLVEDQLASAITAIVKRDAALGEQVSGQDGRVDEMEREIDELIVRLLAKRQPVADDLREVVAGLKIVGILERVGDYAAHVGERAVTLGAAPELPAVLVIARMGKMVRDLFADALAAYANQDARLALSVWQRDQDLDRLYASLFHELLKSMEWDSENIATCTHLLFIAKYIERVGDFATNIAEHVHFLALGHPPQGERPKAGNTNIAIKPITGGQPS
ncbi:MAG: phosphate signaling complex protein PhoU [Alphaproteobacteria bacterium]|nr:phosphate signaling complex protein PhoU [Alphaproteobacteria bacterium]